MNWLRSGVDEEVAKSIAGAIDNRERGHSDLEKELAEVKFEAAIAKKSKEVGFEDMAEYADEMKELVDKGLTLEQSYYAVSYDKLKSRNTRSEIERKVEAKLQNNQVKKEILGNYHSDGGVATGGSSRVQLTPEEKGIAQMAGLTAEEYAAFKGMNSVKDYEKYTKLKK